MTGFVLAIDPGERIGWARSDWTCGTLDLSDVFARDMGEVMGDWSRWLAPRLHGCVLLVLERPFGRNPASIITPTILCARAHEVAFDLKVPRRELAVQTIRKHATGSGRTKKAEVLPAMLKAGWPCEDDHSADACAALMAALVVAQMRRVAA